MPSLTISSTVNCCTGRDPPSPDGLSPRPATSPLKYLRKSPAKIPRSALPSVSQARDSESQHSSSVYSKEESPVLDIADRNDANIKVETLVGSTGYPRKNLDNVIMEKKSLSSINLRAVKQKLKQRLSRDSTLNKRLSRSSIGTSEEEVERRAELRRIRQKRIEEELSDEAIYDEDAKSLSSIPNTINGIRNQMSWITGDPLPLPELKASTLLLPMLSLPRLKSINRLVSPCVSDRFMIPLPTSADSLPVPIGMLMI